jgi:hypothetical protein
VVLRRFAILPGGKTLFLAGRGCVWLCFQVEEQPKKKGLDFSKPFFTAHSVVGADGVEPPTYAL